MPNWKALIAGIGEKRPDLIADDPSAPKLIAAMLCIARETIMERQKKRSNWQFKKYYRDPVVVVATREYVAQLQDFFIGISFTEGNSDPAFEVLGFAELVAAGSLHDDGQPFDSARFDAASKERADAILSALGLTADRFGARIARETVIDCMHRQADALINKGWPDVKVSAKSGKPAFPRRPVLEKLERTGPDHRQDRDLHPDEIIATFGVRGVEFGNWLRDTERQAAVNLTFDALHDFAEVLGIPPSGIGMWHKLGIGFGSRGRGMGPGGTGVAAHYEPDRVVINLTRFAGDGSPAHELGHMFEHGLRDFVCGKDAEPFASAHWNYPNKRASLLANAELNAAFVAVMDVIMKRDPDHDGAGWHRSPFLAAARKLGSYWTKPLEMFARAFECYVFDWLQ
jgi:hypothetical protein